MRKESGGLRLAAVHLPPPESGRQPWGDVLVCALVLCGLSLLLTESFPSVLYPWWLLTLLATLGGLALLLLYQTAAGKWILPIGILLLLVFALIFRAEVLAGFACLGNDFLQTLTAKTGRIYLELANAAPARVGWAVFPLLAALVLLASRAVWAGQPFLLLPLLLPPYAAALCGLFPCGLPCLLLSAGVVLLMMQRSARARSLADPYSGAPGHLLLPVLCAAICLLPGLAMQDRLPTDLRQRLARQWHTQQYDSQSNSMPEGRLQNLAQWNKSDTPALELTMEKPGKLYLRGQIYEVYTAGAWEPVDTQTMAEYAELFYWLHDSGFYGQSQIGLSAAYTTQAEALTLTVKNLSACAAHGYYPYALSAATPLDAASIGDTDLPQTQTMQYYTGSVPQWYEIQKNLASAQGRENISDYLALEQAYAAYVKAQDLQLTQESWSVLERQLALEEGSRTIAEIRQIILDYLDSNMRYDETVRTMNGSGDFLQYTLERSGRGYSVHYATTAVLMLRYMGVPARYVEGYYLSAQEAARYLAGEPITLTEAHAHAWAEYYVSGVGFVPFEVTPGYIDDETLDLGGSNQNAENAYESNQQRFAEVQRPEEIQERRQDRFTLGKRAELLLLLLLLPLLALVILVLRRRARLRRALRAMEQADIREGIALRYGYAAHLLAHSAVQPPEGAQEAAHLNREALFSRHEMSQEQRSMVDDYAARVLAACRKSWTLRQKIRYRLWDCLY